MKKIIALILVLTMCLTLAACGAKKTSLVGKWEYAEEESVLILNEDKTGEVSNGGMTMQITWEYDEGAHLLRATLLNTTWVEAFTYAEDSDTLYCDGWTYIRVAE